MACNNADRSLASASVLTKIAFDLNFDAVSNAE